MSEDPNCGRRQDLETSIQETLELIKQYEDKRRLSDDPKEQRDCERQIANLRRLLEEYQEELARLDTRAESGCVWSLVAKGKRRKVEATIAIIAALITCVGIVLGGSAIGEVVKVLLARPTNTVSVVIVSSPSPAVTVTAIATITSTPTPTPVATVTPTPTPACAMTAPTDAETLFALIDAEAQAVLNEDMERIKVIFAPDAIIRNEATDQEWDNPEAYYSEKFRNEVHCRAEHYDYRIFKLTDKEAVVNTGNRGQWGWEAEGRCTMTYENPPGADRWLFRKDALGCWQIVRFTYNAHIQ